MAVSGDYVSPIYFHSRVRVKNEKNTYVWLFAKSNSKNHIRMVISLGLGLGLGLGDR